MATFRSRLDALQRDYGHGWARSLLARTLRGVDNKCGSDTALKIGPSACKPAMSLGRQEDLRQRGGASESLARSPQRRELGHDATAGVGIGDFYWPGTGGRANVDPYLGKRRSTQPRSARQAKGAVHYAY
jgi:hypothetical protein